MSTDTAPTSTFPADDWDERTERIYTGEALDVPSAPAGPLTPEERQRQEYGGISVGAAFFGWLGALGVMALVGALVAAVALAAGVIQDPTRGGVRIGEATALAAAISGSVLLLLGVYAGSYVAGRLVRFDGGRQGVAVWILVLVSGLVGAGLAVVVDAQYALRSRPSFPELAIGRDDVLLWGAVTVGIVVLLTLPVAIGSGKLGVRYHAKVERAAREEPVPQVAPDEQSS
ncbi:hypothetical protein [Aeromicrobium sp. CTD01-1L150]|uniref:hypothetical protein n=1 Tax=Aeromicrobium sp. CTD01-1L150 TaxID=3341830 RepID=UPI0035BFB1C8